MEPPTKRPRPHDEATASVKAVPAKKPPAAAAQSRQQASTSLSSKKPPATAKEATSKKPAPSGNKSTTSKPRKVRTFSAVRTGILALELSASTRACLLKAKQVDITAPDPEMVGPPGETELERKRRLERINGRRKRTKKLIEIEQLNEQVQSLTAENEKLSVQNQDLSEKVKGLKQALQGNGGDLAAAVAAGRNSLTEEFPQTRVLMPPPPPRKVAAKRPRGRRTNKNAAAAAAAISLQAPQQPEDAKLPGKHREENLEDERQNLDSLVRCVLTAQAFPQQNNAVPQAQQKKEPPQQQEDSVASLLPTPQAAAGSSHQQQLGNAIAALLFQRNAAEEQQISTVAPGPHAEQQILQMLIPQQQVPAPAPALLQHSSIQAAQPQVSQDALIPILQNLVPGLLSPQQLQLLTPQQNCNQDVVQAAVQPLLLQQLETSLRQQQQQQQTPSLVNNLVNELLLKQQQQQSLQVSQQENEVLQLMQLLLGQSRPPVQPQPPSLTEIINSLLRGATSDVRIPPAAAARNDPVQPSPTDQQLAAAILEQLQSGPGVAQSLLQAISSHQANTGQR